MTGIIVPGSEEDVAAIVASAMSNGERLAIRGGGTRGRIGGKTEGTPLSTTGLIGITLYEPAEMIISARAGTPLAEVEAALAEKGQMLPFEPMDHRKLLGTTGTPTIGAVAAGNISGPRRVTSGAARDHLIGVRLVNGRGEIIKNGGRVMKNVTGLDLVKLSAGAYGTLGVLTEVTFKVLPRPQTMLTLAIDGLSAEAALAAMAEAMATPFEVSASARLPASADAPSMTLLRIEGFADSCTYRAGRLATHLEAFGAFRPVDGDFAERLWTRSRDAEHFATPEFATVLRIHVAPSKAAAVLEAANAPEGATLLDWGGGLIWLGLPPGEDTAAIMTRIASAGGHPMIARSVDEPLPTLLPPDPAVAALGSRIKAAFDPHGIFNSGLLAGHI